jgi:hypothetical protein
MGCGKRVRPGCHWSCLSEVSALSDCAVAGVSTQISNYGSARFQFSLNRRDFAIWAFGRDPWSLTRLPFSNNGVTFSGVSYSAIRGSKMAATVLLDSALCCS